MLLLYIFICSLKCIVSPVMICHGSLFIVVNDCQVVANEIPSPRVIQQFPSCSEQEIHKVV